MSKKKKKKKKKKTFKSVEKMSPDAARMLRWLMDNMPNKAPMMRLPKLAKHVDQLHEFQMQMTYMFDPSWTLEELEGGLYGVQAAVDNLIMLNGDMTLAKLSKR